MIELRDYQKEKSAIGLQILKKHNVVLLGFDPRVGKTLTAIDICNNYGAFDVLFITKKKAISSIQRDCDSFAQFDVVVINYESLHKVDNREYDIVVIDESHNLASFPKPGKRTVTVKKYVGNSPVIMLTGTPSPENFVQLYHQFWVTAYSPFEGGNFYEFFRHYGCVAKEFDVGAARPRKDYSNKLEMIKKYYRIKSWKINKNDPQYNEKIKDLSDRCIVDLDAANQANEKITALAEPLVIPLSREDAGFDQEVDHHFIRINMPDTLRLMYNNIKRHGIIECSGAFDESGWVAIASNAADKYGKLLQICGGSIRIEDGDYQILSDFKAREIKQRFSHLNKVAIFYKFRGEREILESMFPNFTDNPDEFTSPDIQYFLGQFTSIKEGVDLKMADCIVMYSADDSAAGLYQSMARLLSRDREKKAPIYWMFCNDGMEEKVFKNAYSKKVFTDRYKKMQKLETQS